MTGRRGPAARRRPRPRHARARRPGRRCTAVVDLDPGGYAAPVAAGDVIAVLDQARGRLRTFAATARSAAPPRSPPAPSARSAGRTAASTSTTRRLATTVVDPDGSVTAVATAAAIPATVAGRLRRSPRRPGRRTGDRRRPTGGGAGGPGGEGGSGGGSRRSRSRRRPPMSRSSAKARCSRSRGGPGRRRGPLHRVSTARSSRPPLAPRRRSTAAGQPRAPPVSASNEPGTGPLSAVVTASPPSSRRVPRSRSRSRRRRPAAVQVRAVLEPARPRRRRQPVDYDVSWTPRGCDRQRADHRYVARRARR